MAPVFPANMVNGFSGLQIFDSYYYALFNVINSTATVLFFLLND
jgi:hypothetical protein